MRTVDQSMHPFISPAATLDIDVLVAKQLGGRFQQIPLNRAGILLFLPAAEIGAVELNLQQISKPALIRHVYRPFSVLFLPHRQLADRVLVLARRFPDHKFNVLGCSDHVEMR